MKKARRGRRDVTTKINSTHGRREWEFYRYPETNRGERERERVVFPWKIQNRGVALFLTNTRRKSEKGTPPILAHWNIVSVYKGGSIYIYIHRGALTCSPPGGSTNVVNRYWYWRVIFARRRRFPRLYQAWPNASGLLYHGQTIAILFAVAKDVKMDIKMRAIEGERVLAIDRKFFHGWCTCPRSSIIEGWEGESESLEMNFWSFRSYVIRRLFVWRENCCRGTKRKFVFIFCRLNHAFDERLDWKLWRYGFLYVYIKCC